MHWNKIPDAPFVKKKVFNNDCPAQYDLLFNSLHKLLIIFNNYKITTSICVGRIHDNVNFLKIFN